MFADFLIGLREGLEASLVVGILLASALKVGSGREEFRGVRTRIWAGVAGAVTVSLAVGALLTFGPRGLTFEVQELIGGGLSLVAVAFVTWMILWMAKSGRDLKDHLDERVQHAMMSGTSLALVAALAVGREGLETALFIWAAAQAAGSSTQPILGAVLGLGVAVLLGWLLYKGSLRLNLRKLFVWSGYGLILVAAGVLAYAIHDLQEGGFLPGLHRLAFDVSGTIQPGSVLATLLKGTINFSPASTVFEVCAWLVYVVTIGVLFTRRIRGTSSKQNKLSKNKDGVGYAS